MHQMFWTFSSQRLIYVIFFPGSGWFMLHFLDGIEIKNIDLSKKDSITLSCDGYGASFVLWYNATDHEITFAERFEFPDLLTLKITDLTPDDSGRYKCKDPLMNGMTIKIFELNVFGENLFTSWCVSEVYFAKTSIKNVWQGHKYTALYKFTCSIYLFFHDTNTIILLLPAE